MKAIRPLIREARLFYLRWALAEIHPLHDDVPMIVRSIHSLMAERKAK